MDVLRLLFVKCYGTSLLNLLANSEKKNVFTYYVAIPAIYRQLVSWHAVRHLCGWLPLGYLTLIERLQCSYCVISAFISPYVSVMC